MDELVMFSVKNTDKAYFSQFERDINKDDFCVINGFHYGMYNRGLQENMLITSNNQPQISFNTVDISDLNYKGNTLDSAVAYFSTLDLGMAGLNIPSGSVRRIHSQLISSYMLNGSLCYVEEKRGAGIERFFATKNASLLKAFSPLLAAKDKKKSLNSFDEQFMNTHHELETGIFRVVKLVPNIDGFHMSKHRINTNKNGFIIPRYAVVNFSNTIAKYLQRHKVKLISLWMGLRIKSLLRSISGLYPSCSGPQRKQLRN
jgi:hypothetical protein